MMNPVDLVECSASAIAGFVRMGGGIASGVTVLVGPVALLLGLLGVAWVVGSLLVDLDKRSQIVQTMGGPLRPSPSRE